MTFQRVLICLDGSPIAERAAERGLELATAIGATVALVHVVDPLPLPEGGAVTAEHDGEQLLAAFARRGAIEPTMFVVLGKPATEIVDVVRQWHADLVVVGTHGNGWLERLGSVADAVVRHSPCAVLVVRAPSRAAMSAQRLLIAVDGSTLAEHAAGRGADLAQKLGATAALVHVIDPDAGTVAGAPTTEHEGRQLLAGLTRGPVLDAAAAFVVFGPPPTAIGDAAHQWQADLVVVGSHGRGRIQRMVLGSVADAVIRHAPCAVLVVPMPTSP